MSFGGSIKNSNIPTKLGKLNGFIAFGEDFPKAKSTDSWRWVLIYTKSILVQGSSKSLQVLLCESQLSALLYTLHRKRDKGIAPGRCHSKHFSLKCCGRLPDYGFRDTDSNGPVIWTAERKNYHTDLYIRIFQNYFRKEFQKPKYFGTE